MEHLLKFSIDDTQHRHRSSPGGVMDGKILVEDDTGIVTDFTTVTWQIGLGETLCYRWVIWCHVTI